MSPLLQYDTPITGMYGHRLVASLDLRIVETQSSQKTVRESQVTHHRAYHSWLSIMKSKLRLNIIKYTEI
jgi:hypothetical protein